MVHSSLIPSWFMGYGIFLEFLVLIITLFVAFYSNKMYKLTKMRKIKYISFAFSLFSASFFILLVTNLFFILKMDTHIFDNIGNVCPMLAIYPGFISYLVFYMLGLITLVYAILGGKEYKIYGLFAIVVIVALLAARNTIILFNLISLVILIALAYFTILRYLKGKNKMNLMFFLFVILLLLGKIPFLLSANHESCAVFDQLVILVAHLLLFGVLLAVMKNGFKKRQA